MNSFDMSWVSLAMAVLQISVVIWKGGELSQRVKHLETEVHSVKVDLNNFKIDVNTKFLAIDADFVNLRADLSEIKSEMRSEISFIKGLLSGWRQIPPNNTETGS
ncbi:MAG: hypothetical protein NTW61_09270 [Candidatus Melainabacteria bacterium]|nr:hypothetical protein [Candidatus Melainabacteria bacterium]